MKTSSGSVRNALFVLAGTPASLLCAFAGNWPWAFRFFVLLFIGIAGIILKAIEDLRDEVRRRP